MTRLIVTADDVGLHRGMTLGAIRAHGRGIVTACSVAGAGRELAHAAELLKECPDLDVGVHLMLVGARPVSSPARVPTLVTRSGDFPPAYPDFSARYVLGRVSLAEVEIELRAQIERLLASGLTLCHMNGHQHVHVLPRVFEVVVRLATEYRIPYVRIPDDRMPGGSPSLRRAAVRALARLARREARAARAIGLRVNDRTIGVVDAGHLTAARVCRLVAAIAGSDALTELVTHPGVQGDEIAQQFDWGYAWDTETAALCDPAVADTMTERGIELVGIRQTGGRTRQTPVVKQA